MKDLKSGIEHLKQAKAHMREANGIMSNCISKLKALEEENAALKAKLELTCMELPIDADGVPVRIGDKMDVDGDCMNVLGYRLYNGELLLVVKKAEGGCAVYTPKPSSVRHYKYSKPDSWEKLEADVNLGCRDYCEKHRLEECDYNMRVHMLARAKKLAGIEEEAQR